jgi:hypothetical protein
VGKSSRDPITADRTSLNSVAAELYPSEVQIPQRIAERVASLVQEVRESLESVVYYEHPLTGCGLLLVVPDRATQPFPDLLARIYRAAPRVTLHCLRPRELFQLALPGYDAPALSVDDQPHLAYCVKLRSALLHGRDCRAEVPLPARPAVFLREHLRGCQRYFRPHYLKLLFERQYRNVVMETVREARRTMSIALVGDGGWQVDLAEVPERYTARFGGARTSAVWRRLEALEECREAAPEAVEDAAYEACWLLERFLKLLASEALEDPPP